MLILLLAPPALAQDYRFPIADGDVQYAYPTAYKDHNGVDWACGSNFYAGHQGSDFGIGGFDGMDAGRTVVAAASGIVVEATDGEFDRCTTADCGTAYGNHVYIQHADGKKTLYGHMRDGTVAVAVGQAVHCGETLGLVGSSGHSSGPHLHFGVWDPEVQGFVDPFWGECSGAPSYWVSQGDYMGVPGTACAAPAPCAPVATLGCGDTVHRAATDPGATSTHAYYGACTTFAEYTGDEVAWTVVPDRDGPVTLSMTGLSADLDLFVLASDTCDATDCLAASTDGDLADGVLTVDGQVGVPLTVVIDGYKGASSDVDLAITCAGAPPDTDVVDSGDTNAGSEPRGCGCSAAPSPIGWSGLAVALVMAGWSRSFRYTSSGRCATRRRTARSRADRRC